MSHTSNAPLTVIARDRLLLGMADAIVEHGYDQLTVVDVVRLARVSKRTFYEHFAGKEDCLVALYESNSAQLIRTFKKAIEKASPELPRVTAGIEAYLTALQSSPALVQTTIVEVLQAGPRGLAVRRLVSLQFAEILLREMQAVGSLGPEAPAIAMALVGGIHELLLQAIEEDRADQLSELSEPINELLRPFVAPAAMRVRDARGEKRQLSRANGGRGRV